MDNDQERVAAVGALVRRIRAGGGLALAQTSATVALVDELMASLAELPASAQQDIVHAYWYRALAREEEASRRGLNFRLEETREFEIARTAFAELFVNGSASRIPRQLRPDVVQWAEILAYRALSEAGQAADLSLIDDAIAMWRRIEAYYHQEVPGRVLGNLSNGLQARYEQTGAITDLEEAVAVERRAFEGTAQEDSGRPARTFILAHKLTALAAASENLDLLDEAQDLVRASLASPHREGPEWAADTSDFAVLFHMWFLATRQRTYLDDAVNLCSDAVVAARDSDVLPMALSNLGNYLAIRFERYGSPDDLGWAVEATGRAVRHSAAEDPLLPIRRMNLVHALLVRYGSSGKTADLDEAVKAGRLSAEGRKPRHPEHHMLLANLGRALHERFDRFGAATDLDEALTFLRAAVEETPDDKPAVRAGNLSDLAIALRAEYELTGVSAGLDAAVDKAREAVTTADGRATVPEDRALYQANLGNLMHRRFEVLHARPDLEEAVDCLRSATVGIEPHHSHWFSYMSGLAAALLAQHRASGDREPLDRALDVTRRALDAAPAGSARRASSLATRAEVLVLAGPGGPGQEQDRLREAADCFREAVTAQASTPSRRMEIARTALDLLGHQLPYEVAGILGDAVELLPELAARHLQPTDQHRALGGPAAGITADAAALTLAREDLPPALRAEQALRMLEAGRSVLFSQALDTRSDLALLRMTNSVLAEEFVRLRETLDSELPLDLRRTSGIASASGLDEQAIRRGMAAEFENVLARIRSLAGFGDFARLPALATLIDEAAAGPVVIVNVSLFRSDALLVTAEGVRHLPLPLLDHATLADRTDSFQQALNTVREAGMEPSARRRAQSVVRDVLAWLWNVLAEPVLDTLGLHGAPAPDHPWPRMWWATSGPLSLLPVHAAGHHGSESGDRSVIDRVVSSHTPSIRALHHARRQAHAAAGGKSGAERRSLIVAMPTTPGLGPSADLPFAQQEAEALMNILPTPVLLQEPTGEAAGCTQPAPEGLPTRETVLNRMRDCTIAHFACHGSPHPHDPSRSSLLLHDHATTPLTVNRLSQVRLDTVQLAYLSACRTAHRNSNLLHETVHLAAAFQLAGFPHVIATLWEIADDTAIEAAVEFYHHLADSPGDGILDTDRAAHALHHTVRHLRERHPKLSSTWSAYLHAGA